MGESIILCLRLKWIDLYNLIGKILVYGYLLIRLQRFNFLELLVRGNAIQFGWFSWLTLPSTQKSI